MLCLVVDRELCGPEPAARIADAVRAGVDWIQLRERNLEGAPQLRFADEVVEAARRAAGETKRPLRVIVNRRADIALALGADGLHLGFDAMDIVTARRVLGEGAWIGVSTHSAAEALAAVDADYVHLAPIFPPISKAASRPPLGCGAIAEAARSGMRVIAQGGIDTTNVAEVRAAGAFGVAVTGAILAARDVGEATAEIRRELG